MGLNVALSVEDLGKLAHWVFCFRVKVASDTNGGGRGHTLYKDLVGFSILAIHVT